MDITPLYELRGRLRTAMIAGTNLLPEDFRLKRAVEAMEPLEKASPVFAKIGELGRNLLSPEQTDKAGALLDTITLVDAVLCTQGTVTVAGEVEPADGNRVGTTVTNAPYSILKTLLEALTSSGSGHYSYVLDTHREHPELFGDYRVKAAMVQALSASYADLADCVAEWLREDGEEILPLLQNGFNPKGKKDMVRRVHVMEAVAGAKANEFYKSMLPEAEKEVRQALIYALRHSPDNLELIMELTKTERGNAKKIAYFALACNEDERAGEFFRSLYVKKPADVMEYLYLSKTKWASALVAECLGEQMSSRIKMIAGGEKAAYTKEQGELLEKSLRALAGKRGAEICEVYRTAAALEDEMNQPVEGEGKNFAVTTFGILKGSHAGTLSFENAVPYFLHLSLCLNPDRELCSLAVGLYEGQGSREKRPNYFAAALAAKLLTEGDCCDWLEEQLKRKEMRSYLKEGLRGLCFDETAGQYVIRMDIYSGADTQLYVCTQKAGQEIAGRFADILMDCKDTDVDKVLSDCINPGDENYCRRLEEYFYSRALTVSSEAVYSSIYMEGLRRCGCTRCEGLLIHYLRSRNRTVLWQIHCFLNDMPGSREAKIQEAMRALELIEKGEIKVYNWNKDFYMEMLDKLKY